MPMTEGTKVKWITATKVMVWMFHCVKSSLRGTASQGDSTHPLSLPGSPLTGPARSGVIHPPP